MFFILLYVNLFILYMFTQFYISISNKIIKNRLEYTLNNNIKNNLINKLKKPIDLDDYEKIISTDTKDILYNHKHTKSAGILFAK